MDGTASSAPGASPPRSRGLLAAFCGVAAILLAYLFRDAWLHGHVLGQADILFEYLPWRPHKPPGIRAANRLFHDVPTVFVPFMYHAREAILSGEFPLWPTAIGAGHPFFASFQSAVLSPFTLLIYALPFPAGLTANAAARLFIGGVGMFLYLRALGVRPAAVVFGGTAFLLNPFSIAWLEHPLSAAAAWLPWMLLAAEHGVRRCDARSAAGMAIVTSLALLSGHPETAFKVALLALTYAVYRGIAARCAVRAITLVAGGMVLGLLASSIQVLPFLEYTRESRVLAARSETSGPLFTNPVASIVTALVPEFYATPLRNRYVLDGGNYAEQQVYPGIVTWVLAAASLTHRRFRGLAFFFLAAAAVAMLIMYGTPVADLAVAVLPPLRYAALSRFGLIAIASVMIAAALAVDALTDVDAPTRHQRRRHIAVAVLASAAMAVVVGLFLLQQRDLLEHTRQWTQTIRAATRATELLIASLALILVLPRLPGALRPLAPAALIAVDLMAFADGLHPLTPKERFFPPLAELSTVHEDPDIFRVAGWSQALLPNTALVYGVQDFRSYDGIGVRDYSALQDVGFHFNGAAHELVNVGAPHLLDLLNIKYVLGPAELDLPRDRYQLLRDGDTRLYRDRTVLPRAFLVDEILRATGDDARRTIRNGFDMARVALVDRLPGADQRPDRAGGSVGEVRIAEYRNRRVDVETRADGARFLVLTDVYYPGWTAAVDGVQTPIYRANYAFRGVPVPAGEHTVTFRYEPSSFRYGAWLSLAGVFGVGLPVVAGTRRAIRREALP